MFRVRRVHDDALPIDRAEIEEVKQILVEQFGGASAAAELERFNENLRNPFGSGFRSILYIAERQPRRVAGFALIQHDPVIGFCYLEYVAATKNLPGRGIGAAMYEKLREECQALDVSGIFMECLPDDPQLCQDETARKQNAARLRFYERYGTRPLDIPSYQTLVLGHEGDNNLPYLVYDGLDRVGLPPAAFVQRVVTAILQRKYGHLVDEAYIEQVTAAIVDPVTLRPPRYVGVTKRPKPLTSPDGLIALTVNDRHSIFHIRERGYVESPVRVRSIRSELEGSGLFQQVPVRSYPRSVITDVHDAALVDYLEEACAAAPDGKSIYPYVFPVHNPDRPPQDRSLWVGYFCVDTFTPINRAAFPAARHAVDCGLTAAEEILSGRRLAYALVRPPGHHAERRLFGGFCYFNTAAIAAHFLAQHGTVALLDIDYHHGNGQQDIFYERADVLTISIHGDPSFAYPYFAGFADEIGRGAGEGFNLNIPLPEAQNGNEYRTALTRACERIADFGPKFLVVSLGLDPAKGDPTGTWSLGSLDFEKNGRLIRELGLPTLVVQEGGYRTRTLGINARHFFQGLAGA